MLIIGGIAVVALFAALVAPWFINWNDYRSAFEAEAGKILGQPVHVVGSANASILPTPSLTFTKVQVGEVEGKPMMTVDRFEVTIELMPLLQGEIRVISMKLQKPQVAISVDDTGTVDWFIRNEASKSLDPDKVDLENVEISDGRLTYADARTGIDRVFAGVNAQLEARSLYGPWRVTGSFLDGERRVPFQLATGRRTEKGVIRLKTDFSPANWPVSISADGDLQSGPDGVSYAGTYLVTEVVPAAGAQSGGGGDPSVTGWKSEGTFALTRDRLAIDKAVLTIGPPDRPYSLAGSLDVALGRSSRFDAVVQARQLDLDRSLGNGPAQPIDPKKAAASLVAWAGGLALPSIPGRIAFDVPGIIVGGAAIQDVRFRVEPDVLGWRVTNLSARLPGQASLAADGTLTTAGDTGFNGNIHLVVNAPATFAAWWRGNAKEGSGRLLSAFDLAGKAEIADGQLAMDNLVMTVGDATVTGRFAWTEAKTRDRRRHLGTDLKADRIDFGQLKALADLLVGQNLADTAALADSYAIKLSAGALSYEDIDVRDVAIDASFADDALTVNQFRVGDIGGASFDITQGRIANPFGDTPEGALQAEVVAATSLKGVIAVLDGLPVLQGAGTWLAKAEPALVPAGLKVAVKAAPAEGHARYHVSVTGAAADTTLAAEFDLAGRPSAWRDGSGTLSLKLDALDGSALARQAGLSVPAGGAGPGHLEISAKGIPAKGIDAVIGGDLAGLSFASTGKLVLPADSPSTYSGSLKLTSADLAPLLSLASLDIPGAAAGTPLALDGTIATKGAAVTVASPSAKVGDRLIGGAVTATVDGPRWNLDGDIHADEVDLGWISSLGLGFAVEPTGDRFSPWSKAPFGSPSLGPFAGRLKVATDRFAVTDQIVVTDAAMLLALDDDRIDLDLSGGRAAGGTMSGGLSVHNFGGNASVAGHVEVKGAALSDMIWERAGHPVASGTVDFSANFEAAGRSPAGLVSSLTGGGTITAQNGEAGYINPKAAALIIRASDLGQDYTDETLQAAFESYVDGGSLPFTKAEGAFAIAAGTIRLKDFTVAAKGAGIIGNSSVDLNGMTIDSDLRIAFDPGDDKAKGASPQVGMIFRGPLVQPVRSIDTVQFGSYLNIRQEERIQEILGIEQADRAEKERLNRLKRKLRDDADRRVADFNAADAEAKSAVTAAAAARAAADEAARQAVQSRAVEKTATDAANAANVARDKAEQASNKAARDLASARSDSAAADAAAASLAAAVDQAKARSDMAANERAAAVKAASDGALALRAAEAAAVKATAQRVAAEKAVAEKASAVSSAADALTAAEADEKTAKTTADTAASGKKSAEDALAVATDKAARLADIAAQSAAAAKDAAAGTDEIAAKAAADAAQTDRRAADEATQDKAAAQATLKAAAKIADTTAASLDAFAARRADAEAALDRASRQKADAGDALADKAKAETAATGEVEAQRKASDAAAAAASDKTAAAEAAAGAVDDLTAKAAAARTAAKSARERVDAAAAVAEQAATEAARTKVVADQAKAALDAAAADRVAADAAAADAVAKADRAAEVAKAAEAKAALLKPVDLAAMAAPDSDAPLTATSADGALSPITTGATKAPLPAVKPKPAAKPKGGPIDLLSPGQ